MNLIASCLNDCTASFYIIKNEKLNCTRKNFTVLCEKSKTVSFASSIIKNIVVFPALPKFAVKLIC